MQDEDRPDSIPTADKPRGRPRYRSAFWGVVLVGIGAILLLANFDIVSGKSLAVLALVWPILIVGIGFDLLFGRRSWALGGLVGVVTVGLIIVLMLLGPGFGWVGDTDLKVEKLSVPVGQATSASVALDSSRYGAKVYALEASSVSDRPLLDATVRYHGSLRFESSGDPEKSVSIAVKDRHWWWFWRDLDDAEPWSIGLDPSLPLNLSIQHSSGSSDLDLSGLRVSDVEVRVSSGSARVNLPALSGQKYPVRLKLSSGDLQAEAAAGAWTDMKVDISSGDARVTLGDDSDVNVTFNGSSGGFTLVLPAGQALRVEVREVSSGGVELPSGLVVVEKGDGEEGVWETQGYSAAAHKVLLTVEHMSSGKVRVRQGD